MASEQGGKPSGQNHREGVCGQMPCGGCRRNPHRGQACAYAGPNSGSGPRQASCNARRGASRQAGGNGSTGANEFAAEALAKARCPTDTVVWANLKSKIYHFSGTKDYGTTKEGAYMCEKDATAQGVRAAKNEKHP